MTAVEDHVGVTQQNMCLYKVGQRVIYTVQFNNPGESMPPDMKINGSVIHVFGGSGTQPPTYRIELDKKWSERVAEHARGQKIIVGNVYENRLALIEPDGECFL
jgi:hypothetical protein